MTVEYILERLSEIVGPDWVASKHELIERYLADETAKGVRPKAASDVVVVKPSNAQEISQILKLATDAGVPVFPRGGGTGLCGGAIPTRSGIVLSLERMDKIVEVDKDNLMVVAEAGVTLGQLEEAVEASGLFFPPHPGDEGAQLGGMIACNAGGSRAVKYGIMRNYVKGLEVVVPTGEILQLGGKLLKDNSGYDLMHLIIGSEGTLAVITQATLRLYPAFASTATLIIPFESRHAAVDVVPKMLQMGIIPLAVEYVEKDLVKLSAQALGLNWPCEEGSAQLLITLAGENEEIVYDQCEKIAELAGNSGAAEAIIAERREEQGNILKVRSEIYTALKPKTFDIMDAAVPPAEMGHFMDAIDEIASRFGTKIPLYGHAADGNLHAHIMDNVPPKDADAIKLAIYQEGVRLGGKITAEHGVGKIRNELLPLCLSPKAIELMKAIKGAFDPKGILNPDCALS
ncbi:MAG TPA: FAD-binding oxidoreductase [Thermosynergistes sp.]|nr:FAD-binding oxidoreductase [Thermosynergistes sp.]